MSAMDSDRFSPTQQALGFDYDEGHKEQSLTALVGIPLLVQAFRSLGLPASVKRNVSVKQRERGYDEATFVESFVILNAAGGECLDDFAYLRKDAVRELVGHDLPSSEAARHFLYQFHDEGKIEAARQLPAGKSNYIVGENEALRGLGQVNTDLVRELSQRGEPQKIATIDLDSTVIESWKQEPQATYLGGRGYQPMLALWAEMNLIMADEFRDGNVPAQQQPLPVARRAFQALPESVTDCYFRGATRRVRSRPAAYALFGVGQRATARGPFPATPLKPLRSSLSGRTRRAISDLLTPARSVSPPTFPLLPYSGESLHGGGFARGIRTAYPCHPKLLEVRHGFLGRTRRDGFGNTSWT
jgi:hypothetical protein